MPSCSVTAEVAGASPIIPAGLKQSFFGVGSRQLQPSKSVCSQSMAGYFLKWELTMSLPYTRNGPWAMRIDYICAMSDEPYTHLVSDFPNGRYG